MNECADAEGGLSNEFARYFLAQERFSLSLSTSHELHILQFTRNDTKIYENEKCDAFHEWRTLLGVVFIHPCNIFNKHQYLKSEVFDISYLELGTPPLRPTLTRQTI